MQGVASPSVCGSSPVIYWCHKFSSNGRGPRSVVIVSSSSGRRGTRRKKRSNHAGGCCCSLQQLLADGFQPQHVLLGVEVAVGGLVDPWAPNAGVDSQSIASQLFAASLFPYLGFLYHITISKSAPKLTLFGFYFLLVFVAATIPAGIYAKVKYGTSLANVDWLHGGAESMLTLTNLFIVLGLRGALRLGSAKEEAQEEEAETTEDD